MGLFPSSTFLSGSWSRMYCLCSSMVNCSPPSGSDRFFARHGTAMSRARFVNGGRRDSARPQRTRAVWIGNRRQSLSNQCGRTRARDQKTLMVQTDAAVGGARRPGAADQEFPADYARGCFFASSSLVLLSPSISLHVAGVVHAWPERATNFRVSGSQPCPLITERTSG